MGKEEMGCSVLLLCKALAVQVMFTADCSCDIIWSQNQLIPYRYLPPFCRDVLLTSSGWAEWR